MVVQANAELEHLDGECASLEDQLQAKSDELERLQMQREAEVRVDLCRAHKPRNSDEDDPRPRSQSVWIPLCEPPR